MNPADDRRRTPQHKAAHYATIAVSTLMAIGVGVWLMAVGRP